MWSGNVANPHLPVSTMALKCCPPTVMSVRYSSSSSEPMTVPLVDPLLRVLRPPRNSRSSAFLRDDRGTFDVRGTTNGAVGILAGSVVASRDDLRWRMLTWADAEAASRMSGSSVFDIMSMSCQYSQ